MSCQLCPSLTRRVTVGTVFNDSTVSQDAPYEGKLDLKTVADGSSVLSLESDSEIGHPREGEAPATTLDSHLRGNDGT